MAIDVIGSNSATVTSIKLRKPGRDAALNDWRALACDCSSHPRHIVIHEFESLLVRRLFVSLIKTSCKFMAADHKECPLRGRGCNELPEKSPVSKGYREEKDETDQQHTTAC